MSVFSIIVSRIKGIVDSLEVLEGTEYVEKTELVERAKIDDSLIKEMLDRNLIEKKREKDNLFYRITPGGEAFFSIKKGETIYSLIKKKLF